MNPRRGTPKSLAEAIANALNESLPRPNMEWKSDDDLVCSIASHVQEKLAQDFGIATLKGLDVTALWAQLFPDSPAFKGTKAHS